LAGQGKGLRGRVGGAVAANTQRANGGGFQRRPRAEFCSQAAGPQAAKTMKCPATPAKCLQDSSGNKVKACGVGLLLLAWGRLLAARNGHWVRRRATIASTMTAGEMNEMNGEGGAGWAAAALPRGCPAGPSLTAGGVLAIGARRRTPYFQTCTNYKTKITINVC